MNSWGGTVLASGEEKLKTLRRRLPEMHGSDDKLFDSSRELVPRHGGRSLVLAFPIL